MSTEPTAADATAKPPFNPFDPEVVRVIEQRREEIRRRREQSEAKSIGCFVPSYTYAAPTPSQQREAAERQTFERIKNFRESAWREWGEKIRAAPATNCERHPQQARTKDEERSAHESKTADVLTIAYSPCPECEREERRERNERRLIARGIPPRSVRMTFDAWETEWEGTAAAQRAQALADVRQWCATRPNPFLIILGATGGTGKTALGVAALRSFENVGDDDECPVWQRRSGGIRCLEFRDWMNRLTGLDLDARQRALEDVRGYTALMIDDFGNRFVGAKDEIGGNAWERDAMGTVLNYRFEHKLPTILTSNHDRVQFANKLDPRTVDRISAGRLVIDASRWPSRRAAEGI